MYDDATKTSETQVLVTVHATFSDPAAAKTSLTAIKGEADLPLYLLVSAQPLPESTACLYCWSLVMR
jgi:hypothetical protein